MKQTFFILLAISLCLGSCGKKNTSKDESKNASQQLKTITLDSLSFSERVHAEKDTISQGMKITRTLEFPVKANEGLNLEATQQTFARLYLGNERFEGNPATAFAQDKDSITKEALSLGESWVNLKREQGDDVIPFSSYEDDKTMRVKAEYGNLLSLSLNEYTYQGGAHGLSTSLFYVVDSKNGQIVNDSILFGSTNSNEVAKLIRDEVKKRTALKESDENYLVLLVDVNDINPNNNFFFTDKGITYLYNQYEIAPYYLGQIEINLPYEKILPLVSDTYREGIAAIQKSFL